MNIKEIIDAERWEAGDHGLAPMPSVEHNAALKRIADAVLEDEAALMRQVKLWSTACKEAEERIAELEERIAELEAGVNMYKQSLKTQTAYTDNATKAVMVLKADAEKRIAELKEQLPKVVKPVFNLGYYDCPECEHRILPGPSRYCSSCGSKFNWKDA